MNRAFYGIMSSKSLMSADGKYTNAVYGFLSILFKDLEDLKPDYIAVAFDLKAPTHRHKMYKEYKGTRHAMPQELAEQMPVIKEVLKAMNIAIIEKEGYEADDVIGTISKQASDAGHYVTILSGDRDNFQLATDKVTIKIPRTKAGKTETELFDREKVKEVYGIEPKQLIEVKGLQGDTSDNIPGVPGIGEKTALSLIQKYGNIDNIYEKLEKGESDLKGKQKEKLEENKDLAFLSRTLGRINLEVPIEDNLEDLKLEEWNKAEVLKIFKELNFKRYIERFNLQEENTENTDIKVEDMYKTVEKTAEQIIEKIKENKEMIFYLNTEKDEDTEKIIKEKIVGISIFNKKENEVYYTKIDKDLDSKWKEILENKEIAKIGIDLSKTYILLKQQNITIKGISYDISIASYVLDPNHNKLDIENLAENYLDINVKEILDEEEGTKQEQINLFDTVEENKDDKVKKYTLYAYIISKIKDVTEKKLEEINASTLNERGLKGRFWETYLRPSIDNFQSKLKALSALEKNYFYAVYNFITKELYTSKSGDVDYEGRTGAASLWLSTLAEKCEAGEIIYDLKIKENHAADEYKAGLTLTAGSEMLHAETFLPNFRQGDAIILYERNCDTDNVTNKMVFKGNIEYLTENEIGIRLRATQQNPSVLPAESLYAIEHDTMDTTFRSMYQGLYAYLSARKERRDLLLSQRPPRFDKSLDSMIFCSEDDFTRVALKAKAAQDYFLLIGPPGTGKTSCALKKMVETFHADKDAQILLLSYTNRAVDEICKSLASIAPAVDFIRVGSELSCDEAYRVHLIENELSSCNRRSEVYERIRNCRIIVGTVAAISGKPELFRLKHFDVAIIDEATQILEPQLLGILCARGEDEKDAIDKFVLIGDHKQLPAVVQQNAEQAAIYDESLLSIGLSNLKDSLFERLYRNCTAACSSSAIHRSYDMLCRQGRMHPEVALFANRAFYGGRLIPVGLPHQIEDSDTICRLAFYPSVPEKAGASAKINYSEARIVADLAVRIYEHHQSDFDESRTLGIITPYRSQIALIKKEIESVGIPVLNRILVDTVERFQGSERDVIIYSFCVNYPYQLKFLSNLTEEEGVLIDRKLNVALTRARKQMFITGVPELLERNPLYKSLLKLIEGS